MSTREDAFDEAKRLREQQKKQDAEKKSKESGGNQGNYDELTYVGLEYEQPRIIRIVGNPMSNRDGISYSPKEFYMNWILGDNDSKFRCIWPSKAEQPNWILWKIYDKVMSFTWDNTNRKEGSSGVKIFKVQKEHPAIYSRVAYNGGDPASKFTRSWKPSYFIAMNVLDRQDMDWHKKNQKYKLLSKKIGKDKDGNDAYPEPGISLDCYNEIFDRVVQYYGNWKNYDISLKKYKSGPETSDVAYEAICTIERMKIDKSIANYIVEGDLTEEEESWEKCNLDKIFKITSYQKIMKNLGIFIQSVDSALGTKFYEELKTLAEEEKKKWDESNVTENSSSNSEKIEVKEEPAKEVKEEANKPDPEKRREKKSDNSSEKFDINCLDVNIYKGLSKLSDKEKERIKGIKDTGALVYDTVELLPCTDDTCAFEAPEDFTLCPKCGTKF